jgi:LPS-assembly protein
VKSNKTSLLLTSSLLLLFHEPARAQDAIATEPAPAGEVKSIEFKSDTLEYDTGQDVVTAVGDVRVARGGEKLRADRVVYNRKTGDVRADGNVIVTNANGDIAYADGVTLKETLRDGVVENVLLVLNNGGRLVAKKGSRQNTVSTLDYAAYTPCRVVDDHDCPKEPVWKISAVNVVHDPIRNRVSYTNAQVELFGLSLFTIPHFSHVADNRGGTGLLVPDIRYTQTNGLEASIPYYFKIAPNRDLTLTPHVYTGALPALEGEYSALTRKGAYKLRGFATYGRLIPTSVSGTPSRRNFRGYIEATGRFQLDPRWSISGSLRGTTDRTFLRRYDISRDDRLRSNVEVERVTRSSYFSLSNWAFQTLRAGDVQGQIPLAIPVVDYRKRLSDPLLGGRVELQLNSLALGRTSGQDTQRAFAGARWDLRKLTPLGQEVIFTGYARGDVYHSSGSALTSILPYRGTDGWNGRFISAAAFEVRWPLVGPLLSGTQHLTPRVQIVASPNTNNLRVPNEDARSVDLEDSNLFSLNRFPGYDRWEDGTRITYGLDWGYDAPNWRIDANIGQSYRFSSKATLFPDGTGLSRKTSDVVGRTSVKYKNLVSLTHRYRLDKDNFAVRRNEVDATLGSNQTYATIGYLRLNRNIGPQLEDLRDREEIRLGGRFQLTRHWSVFGSTIIDLTDRTEDPLILSDGFDPIRHRIGFAYEDDCLRLGLTWRRDYDSAGDARRGNTFVLQLSFRNLGR